MSDQTHFGTQIIQIFSWIWYVLLSILHGFYRQLIPVSLQTKYDLKGKRVLVTGAGGGIGRNIALNLAKKGCDLVLWDVFEVPNQETARLCKDYDVDVRSKTVDVTNREAVYAEAKKILAEVGPVDILFNNAGVISDSRHGFLTNNDERMEKLMKVNVISHFWTVKAFLPAMMEQRSGHIVCLASAAGFVGAPGLVDYCSSKFAALGFMEALENETHVQGHPEIHFTSICPTFVDTPMIQNVNTFNRPLLSAEEVAKTAVEAIQLRRHAVFIPNQTSFLYAAKGVLPWNLFKSIVLKRKFDFA
uniref:Uncharacterized protein n=1 Tax=Panagrolaimus sp. JU765 TaxID=591449 RepID=A0AC34RHZ6_9BILA